MSRRRPPQTTTRPPPPPDPIDAAKHFLESARMRAAEFRYTVDDDDDDETTVTGQHPPINISVTIPERAQSSHDIPRPEIVPVTAGEDHGKRPNAGGLVAAIMLLASSLAAICKALGWL